MLHNAIVLQGYIQVASEEKLKNKINVVIFNEFVGLHSSPKNIKQRKSAALQILF